MEDRKKNLRKLLVCTLQSLQGTSKSYECFTLTMHLGFSLCFICPNLAFDIWLDETSRNVVEVYPWGFIYSYCSLIYSFRLTQFKFYVLITIQCDAKQYFI